MRILITGSSGLVGTALTSHCRAAGHEVQGLGRIADEHGERYDLPEGQDALVHLAGENIADGRWTTAKKRRIRESRVGLTARLVATLGALEHPPRTLIAASATGYYGDRGDERLDEDSPPGRGFLADLCQEWEAASAAAAALGIRVVHLRTGIVLSRAGGVLAKMRTPFRLGVGGVLGDGTQWMSWIHIDDLTRLIECALKTADLTGPLNAVAPEPVTNRAFTRALGKVLGRPTILPAPKFGLRLLFGEMADALLLSSAAVSPARALAHGFRFDHPDLEAALRDLL